MVLRELEIYFKVFRSARTSSNDYVSSDLLMLMEFPTERLLVLARGEYFGSMPAKMEAVHH